MDRFFGNVRFSVEASLKPWNRDPDQFTLEISGEIWAIVDSSDTDRKVGSIRLELILVTEAINQGVPLYDVFDAHSGDIEAVYADLFGEDEEPKDEFCIEPGWQNLLHLVSVTADDTFRATTIRVQAVDTAIAAFGSRAIIVAYKREVEFSDDEWKRLGFVNAAGTSLVFRDNQSKNPYGRAIDPEE
jgi:hypothetical protein